MKISEYIRLVDILDKSEETIRKAIGDDPAKEIGVLMLSIEIRKSAMNLLTGENE